MAEAFLKQLCCDQCTIESAGLEPGSLNPLVVKAMAEVGIDISQNQTKGALDLFKAGRTFRHVITVCDQESGERCPIFPLVLQRHHWSFPDPGELTGTEEEKLVEIRKIRDSIKEQVQQFYEEFCALAVS